MTAVWIFFAVLFAALAALMLVAGLRLTAPGRPHAGPHARLERSDTDVDIEAAEVLDPQT